MVGDVQYGGAEVFEEWEAHKSFSYERLALQCCKLEFVDPDVGVNEKDGVAKLRRSNRWNKFSLEKAWWTTTLDGYTRAVQSIGSAEATTDIVDAIGAVGPSSASGKTFPSTSKNAQMPPRPELLPDRVQLSPGKNKYVIIRANHQLEPSLTHWFVKSASPAESGGPYHGNVAQDLR